jgi:hypothetical protein
MVSFFSTVETTRDGGIGHGRLAARREMLVGRGRCSPTVCRRRMRLGRGCSRGGTPLLAWGLGVGLAGHTRRVGHNAMAAMASGWSRDSAAHGVELAQDDAANRRVGTNLTLEGNSAKMIAEGSSVKLRQADVAAAAPACLLLLG